MIEAIGLTKYYGSFRALHDVSFKVARGEVLGFLGPNGAGKSTTMKVLTTFVSASEGTAIIDGFDVHAAPEQVRARLGYLPETPPLYMDMTVEEYLKFCGRARGLSGRGLSTAVERVIGETGLIAKRKNRIITLSKGYKQRTGIAQALIHDPPVLILDEPTSGLDPAQIIEIRKLIARLGETKAVIFSTHILQEAAAVARRLVIINNGRKIADGPIDDLTARALKATKVRLEVRGSFSGLTQALKGVPGVIDVVAEPPAEGYANFALMVTGGPEGVRGACAEIARVVAQSGLQISMLAPERLTLEEVFLRLLELGPQPDIVAPKPVLPAPDDPFKTSGPTRMREREADDEPADAMQGTETAFKVPQSAPAPAETPASGQPTERLPGSPAAGGEVK